eukprot:scaffold942_cov68-Isochrysis_galbana.AAC.1
MEQLAVLWDGVVLFTAYPAAGAPPAESAGHTAHGFVDPEQEEVGVLMKLVLGSASPAVTLHHGVAELTLSADLGTMALRMDEEGDTRIRAFVAGGGRPEGDEDDREPDPDTPGPESGLVAVSARVGLRVHLAIEWRQMFDEAWAATGRRVHSSVLAGIDMAAVSRAYAPVLARVWCAEEARDLMREMQAELGASHADVCPPEEGEPEAGGGVAGGGADGPAPAPGHLCASLAWDSRAGAWRVTRLSEGVAWDETSSATLAAAGGQVGDLLLAIDGTRLREHTPPEEVLGMAAEREVMLTLRRDGGGGAGRGARGDGGAGARGGSSKAGSNRGKAPQPAVTDSGRRRYTAAGGRGGAAGTQRGSDGREWSVRARPAGLARARRAAYLDWVACNCERVYELSGGAVGCARCTSLLAHGPHPLPNNETQPTPPAGTLTCRVERVERRWGSRNSKNSTVPPT